MKNTLTVALVGNPNSGKTTIFNNLTGSRQHVGNYPGVTVEKKEGFCRFKEQDLAIVDLPGTYSLTAFSPEEVVTRNFIAQDKCDVLVDIIDASNLERNLYLAVQFLELERPVVLALNMVDVAESRDTIINDKELSKKLNATVVRTVGSQNKGMEGLLGAAISAKNKPQTGTFKIDYGSDIEAGIALLEPSLQEAQNKLKFPKRWLALKLIENDQDIIKNMTGLTNGAGLISKAAEVREALEEKLGDSPELEIANRRYLFVGEVFRKAVKANEELVTTSDKIDSILTNRWLGMPIFFGLMWLVFNLVFTLGKIPQDWIQQGVKLLGDFIGVYMSDGELKDLVTGGVIGGVGSVIVFLPNIILLFFSISLLEDSGYMARAAFIMDRMMSKAGLHGKSFIPLLLGLGCSVPAIMGTRTLENPRDRLVTILVAPLMSCSARLPVYTVLIGAFFSESVAGNVLFSMYLLGIVLAIVMARIFRSVLFKGSTEPFVMELPPYRVPTLKGIFIHLWERSVLYLQKAGTIILAVAIIVWFLSNYPSDVNYSKDYQDLTAQIESAITVQVEQEVLKPLNITAVEENAALQSLVAQIKALEDEDKAKLEEAEEGSEARVQLEQEHLVKLQKISEANPDVYQYASRYMELQGDLEDQKDKLDKEKAAEKLAQSYSGQVGKFIEPVIRPLGFDWKIGVSLFAAFSAKEVLVSTLGTIYNVGEAAKTSVLMKQALVSDPVFSPLVAYALMVFVLVYSPCMATISVIKRETNSWKWAIFSSVYSTVLAWVLAFIVYQGGRLLGLG